MTQAGLASVEDSKATEICIAKYNACIIKYCSGEQGKPKAKYVFCDFAGAGR